MADQNADPPDFYRAEMSCTPVTAAMRQLLETLQDWPDVDNSPKRCDDPLRPHW